MSEQESTDAPAAPHDVSTLFAGTYLEFLGFRLMTWKEGFVRLEMPVRDEHRNTVGYLHGGVIASLLDIAGAFAGSYGRSRDYVSVTINMSTNYLSPSRSNSVIVEGELVRSTRSLFFAQSRLLDPENSRLCATATGTYKPQAREGAAASV
jgi:uncharacterized protein (TIGR00369 family)